MKITRLSMLILLLFICILIYFVFINLSKTIDDKLKDKANFLTQSKEILKKDFSNILDSMKPKDNNNIYQQNKTQITNEPKPKLYAILNKTALINNKWLKQKDIISYNDNLFIIIKITTKYVKLQNTSNGDIMQLDIFPTPKDIVIEIK